MTRNEQILSEVQKRFSSNDTHLVSKISTFIDGAKWADEYPKKGMVSLDQVCDMLYAMLTTQDINDYDYVTAPAYNNVVDFVEDFRKSFKE